MGVSILRRAIAGDAEAQFTLGLMYDNGEGVPQDFAQANAWWRKAGARSRVDEEKRCVK